MSTIDQQLELERNMSARGREIYRANTEQAIEKGRGHETDAAQRLMREFIRVLATKLEEWAHIKGPGMNGLGRPLLRVIDPHVAMYLALFCVFDHFTASTSLTSLAIKIGGMVEDDMRLQLFRDKHAAFYDEVMRDMKRKGVKNYGHKRRVLTYKANEKEDEWPRWSVSDRAAVGMKLIDIIHENTDLVRKEHRRKKSGNRVLDVVTLEPTESAAKWMEEHHTMREMLYPERLPCVIPPDDWTDIDQGGYYSAELRNTTKLIKTINGAHRKYIRRHWRTKKKHWLVAVNALQRTPWAVNTRVLAVIQEVWRKNLGIGIPAKDPLTPPPSPHPDVKVEDMTEKQKDAHDDWKSQATTVYTREKERVAKSFQLSRILRLASDFSDYASFWYVWTCDFRGRMYTSTSGFSPQGPDVGKGLLQFANGKRLGERGWYWFRVNMANRFGYDKENYDDRVKWVDAQHDKWIAAAEDPIGNRSIWSGADKPYQFLGTCFEYAEAISGGNPHDFTSHLPVGLDGSCNGLQNFSAMLRDEVGGRATNLVPQDKPADIYAEVGDVTGRKIRQQAVHPSGDTEQDVQYQAWARFAQQYGVLGAIPRKMAKRPVMTLPYGSTRQSCTAYIFDSLVDLDEKCIIPERRFKHSVALTPLLWDSIGEVVVAARHAMDWLQKSASVVSKTNSPVYWDTPDGFPVWQAEYKTDMIRVSTQLAGEFRIKLRPYNDEINPRAMRQSISPNFVHSFDANHLRETVRRGMDAGISDWACIHDDYGTHAADIDTLHRVLREAFVHQYEAFDPLSDFKDFQECLGHELPDLPGRGTLNIQDVLKSKYFFG